MACRLMKTSPPNLSIWLVTILALLPVYICLETVWPLYHLLINFSVLLLILICLANYREPVSKIVLVSQAIFLLGWYLSLLNHYFDFLGSISNETLLIICVSVEIIAMTYFLLPLMSKRNKHE